MCKKVTTPILAVAIVRLIVGGVTRIARAGVMQLLVR
jgi:hypothetical protein